MKIRLAELDPPDRPITREELRENCGFLTVEEAAADPYREPSNVRWPKYTWRDRVECLERRYNEMHHLGRSEREIQEAIEMQLDIMRNQGVNVDE